MFIVPSTSYAHRGVLERRVVQTPLQKSRHILRTLYTIKTHDVFRGFRIEHAFENDNFFLHVSRQTEVN